MVIVYFTNHSTNTLLSTNELIIMIQKHMKCSSKSIWRSDIYDLELFEKENLNIRNIGMRNFITHRNLW